MFAHFSLRLLAHRKPHPRVGLPSTIHGPGRSEVGEHKLVRAGAGAGVRRRVRCRGYSWRRYWAGVEFGRGVGVGAREEGGHRAGAIATVKGMSGCMCCW
jgi:hypothetical protein